MTAKVKRFLKEIFFLRKMENVIINCIVIRSITDTCIKNDQNILAAFKTIANLQPE